MYWKTWILFNSLKDTSFPFVGRVRQGEGSDHFLLGWAGMRALSQLREKLRIAASLKKKEKKSQKYPNNKKNSSARLLTYLFPILRMVCGLCLELEAWVLPLISLLHSIYSIHW